MAISKARRPSGMTISMRDASSLGPVSSATASSTTSGSAPPLSEEQAIAMEAVSKSVSARVSMVVSGSARESMRGT